MLVAVGLTARPAAAASLMWVVENQSNNVYTVDVNTLTATLVGSAGVDVVFGGLGFAQNGTLYAWNTNPGNLYSVNQGTGAFTLIGGSALFGADTFDINPLTNEAIAWSVDGTLNDVNLGTGATSFRVATSPTGQGVASAFGSDGTYYQYDRNTGNLNRVNTTTGVLTTIGGSGPSVNATNLAFNPDNNTLYTIAIMNALFPLYRIDPLTGARVFVGNITGLGNDPNQQITMGTFNVAAQQAVPEPATMALVGAGLLTASRRLRRRSA
jgi:hypothetical protein